MSDASSNGTAAPESEGSDRARAYVVLEQGNLVELVNELLKSADVGLSGDEWERIENMAKQHPAVYTEVARPKSRNAHHALMQVGRQRTAEGTTPPMVAVSERMFQPRHVEVSFDPKVSVS